MGNSSKRVPPPVSSAGPVAAAGQRIRALVDTAMAERRPAHWAVLDSDEMPLLSNGGFTSQNPAVIAAEFRTIIGLMQREIDRALVLASGRAPESVYIHFRRGRHLVMTVAEIRGVIEGLTVIAAEMDAMVPFVHPVPAEA